MSSTDLKLALRHFWRRKVYTIIILSSLTIGFSCTTLLVSFLIAEIKTDTFHARKDHVFQLFSNDPFGGNGLIGFIPKAVSDYMRDNYPEVESICTLGYMDKASLATGVGEFNDLLLLTSDSSFFSAFTFPLKEGSVYNLQPDNIILTEEKARVLFGRTDVLGELISIRTADSTRVLVVSGLFADAPEKSHLKFDGLIHHAVLKDQAQGGATYVLLNHATQPDELATKVNYDDMRPGLIGTGKMSHVCKPLTESYFNKDNRMPYMKTRSEMFIWMGCMVCGVIFFMASFNFIHLFFVYQRGRKKEVGIKKTLGASIKNVIQSAFTEVILYIALSLALSILCTIVLLDWFNSTLDASLHTGYLLRWDVIVVMGCAVFLSAFFVVIVTSLQQQKVPPVNLMKKSSVRAVMINKPFFVLQFVISLTLIICSAAIIRQMDFVEHEPLGFNRNLIQLQAPGQSFASAFYALRQDLTQLSGVHRIAMGSGNPISGNTIMRYEIDNGEFYTPYLFSGDSNYVHALGLTLLEGTFPSAGNGGKLVNETLARLFNLHHPVGEKIPGTNDRIVGVVKDFTCVSFKEKIPPVIIDYSDYASRMLIDHSGRDPYALIPQIENVWKKVFPGIAFSYQVIQQDLLNKYKEERFLYKVVIASSTTSMVISCFGLFALSWSVVEGRVKEIGIRKVLGATPNDILFLLIKSFLKPVFVAFLIAVPMGYFLMDRWLDSFVRKITLDLPLFVYSGCTIILIALLTISLQTIKAALLNPVEELKKE